MALSTLHMRQAARKAALQAARGMGIEETRAMRAAPVALWLVLYALGRNSTSPFLLTGLRPGLRYALNRCREDVFKTGRLGASDVKARGEALVLKVMGRHAPRAVRAVESLAGTDERRARAFLGVCAVAAIRALSETKGELNLTVEQTIGVLMSEAALLDNADPSFMPKMRDWVFRPPFWSRPFAKMATLFRRPAGRESASLAA